MAFKTMASYNEQKYGNFFRLVNDRDYADVIFLYRNTEDVLMCDTHYIKSEDYSGYVQCCASGCPACNKGIRVQPKLFIPLYVLSTSDASQPSQRIQYWDRTLKFQPQLVNDVFKSYPNPSEFVFRITRHGAAGDINTTYDIRAIEPNAFASYESILQNASATMPDHYGIVCKDLSSFELNEMLSNSYTNSANSNSYGNGSHYNAVPRGGYTPQDNIPEVPDFTNVPDIPDASVTVNAPIPEDITSNENVNTAPVIDTPVVNTTPVDVENVSEGEDFADDIPDVSSDVTF